MFKPEIDGFEQSLQITNGTISPLELVEEAIERIEKLNPSINAVVTKTYEKAREMASKPLPKSPLSGIPILVKDLIQVKGVRNTSGAAIFKDNIARYDSEIIKRMKNAGLIILGVTNTPEFGLIFTTEPRLHGPTHNPWNLEYSSGGSSGGAAAAVASGMVSIAHGSDGGGSIRIPSSFCGLFGLKPTRGRVPYSPNTGANLGLSINHALTNSIRDSAAFLDIIDGFCAGEPFAAPPKTRPYLEEIGSDAGKLKIALMTEALVGDDFHPDVEKVVRSSAEICTELGHNVTEVELSSVIGMEPQRFIDSFFKIWTIMAGSVLSSISLRMGKPLQREWFEDLTWALYQRSATISATDYKLSNDVLELFGRNLNRFMSDYDVILTATVPDPPFKLGEVDIPYQEDYIHGFDDIVNERMRWGCLTMMSNASGNPAMSVPLGIAKTGLPIGTQFIGRFGDEATLFRVASQLEKAVSWNSIHC